MLTKIGAFDICILIQIAPIGVTQHVCETPGKKTASQRFGKMSLSVASFSHICCIQVIIHTCDKLNEPNHNANEGGRHCADEFSKSVFHGQLEDV